MVRGTGQYYESDKNRKRIHEFKKDAMGRNEIVIFPYF